MVVLKGLQMNAGKFSNFICSILIALYYVVCFKKHLSQLPFTVMQFLNISILPNFMQWRRSGIVGVL